MSSYRYVVFPRGKQPSAAEVAQLQSVADALGGRFAWGTCRHEPRLAVAFEAPTFDHVLKSDALLRALITQWQSHGCELLDHLAFVKDAAALKPQGEPWGSSPRSAAPAHRSGAGESRSKSTSRSRTNASSSDHTRTHTPTPTRLFSEKFPTTDYPQPTTHYLEPLARSLLSVDRTLERYNLIARLAAATPYLMMAAAALLTIALGLYAREKLMDSGREARKDTIERLASPPAEEQHSSF